MHISLALEASGQFIKTSLADASASAKSLACKGANQINAMQYKWIMFCLISLMRASNLIMRCFFTTIEIYDYQDHDKS